MEKKKTFLSKIQYIYILMAGMLGIYTYSMFTNRPWYDELYTYYYFISRGPVYAAIHWPVPNNHMGYSVLSAVIDKFGNSYLGLRGVSVICSVISLFLIYRLAKKISGRNILGLLGCDLSDLDKGRTQILQDTRNDFGRDSVFIIVLLLLYSY